MLTRIAAAAAVVMSGARFVHLVLASGEQYQRASHVSGAAGCTEGAFNPCGLGADPEVSQAYSPPSHVVSVSMPLLTRGVLLDGALFDRRGASEVGVEVRVEGARALLLLRRLGLFEVRGPSRDCGAS